MRTRLAWLTPLAVLVTAGCFATRNDVRLLQADVARMNAAAEQARRADAEAARSAGARSDSLVRDQLTRLAASVKLSMDSLVALSENVSRFRAGQQVTNRDLAMQIETIQDMLAASQKTMADVRARVEAQEARGVASADTSGAPETPQSLYRMGLDFLSNGSSGSAREAFQEFLKLYPNDKLIPEVTYQLARTYAAEKNMDATADSLYAVVVDRYRDAPIRKDALFKQAEALVAAGQTSAARRKYDRIITDYPNTNEARLARERRDKLPPG